MNTNCTIRKALAGMILFFLTPVILLAQWNTNTAVNELIATVPIADMQSVATSDAKTWVAFYHESGTNYDMRAQLFDAAGNKLLGADGVLVSNQPSGTAIFVFNVCLDASNNLVIACQDERTGTPQAVLYKISQAGAHLWSSSGIILGAGLSPYPALLSTGEIVVAWNESSSNTLKMQKISTAGAAVWTIPITIQVGSSNTTRGQIIGNTGGNFTMVYQKKGVGISTTLYAQMFSNSGTALYAALQISNLTTSGARYYSIAAEGDTTYFGYYASSGSRFNSYLQKIVPGGTIPWGMNGSSFNTSISPSDNYQMTTNIALTPGSPYVWSVCTFSNTAQTQYGVYVQKFSRGSGTRLLTDQAKVVYAISTSTDQQAGSLALVSDCPMFMSYDVDYKIYATRLDASGNFVWPGNRVELSSTVATPGNGKMRFGFTPDGPNRCAGVWTEKRTTNYMGYAQGVSIGGLIGLTVATQGGAPAVITTPGGTLQMVSTVYPSSASQAVTWSIVPGTGQATISAGGLVTAQANGTVYAKATAVQDVTVKDSLLITISNQVPVAPAVTTMPASNVVTTTATLNGTVNANNNSTTASFQWGLTTSYGNTAAATPGTVTGSSPVPVLANISGLTIGTTYHFRCVGTNTAGTTYGNDMTFVAGCTSVGVAGAITGPTAVCNGSTGKVYSIAPVSAATGYTWTVPAGATITAGQNTTSITVTFGTTSGNVTCVATNSCSSSNTSTLAVTVNPPPVPTINGSNNVCSGAGLVAYWTETGMSNYVWTVSAGGTISSGQGTSQLQVTWSSTGPQTVSVNYTGTSGCAATTPTTYNVTVSPMPDPAGPITGTAEVCAGSAGITYYVDPISNATAYVWTLPAGATVVSGANSNSITVNFAGNAVSGDITVAGNNICGNGTVSPAFPVTVHPIPPQPEIRQNGLELISNAPDGNQWYYKDSPAGPGVIMPGYTNDTIEIPYNAVYYYSIVTLNNCSSLPSDSLLCIIEGTGEVSNGSFSVYPNPASGRFTISTTGKELHFRIISLTGVEILEGSVPQGIQQKEVDVTGIPAGIYFVIAGNRAVKLVIVN